MNTKASMLLAGATARPEQPPAPAISCGTCEFGRMVKEDLTMRECNGVPPTPVIVGMGPQGPQIVVLRARLPSSTPGCALHRRKASIITG